MQNVPQPPTSSTDGRSGDSGRGLRGMNDAHTTTSPSPSSPSPVGSPGVPSTTTGSVPVPSPPVVSTNNPDLAAIPRRKVKRPHNPVFNGQTSSWSAMSAEYNCSLCLDVLREAVITRCGHTFCHTCIKTSLTTKPICPKCGTAEHPDNLIPNYVANELVARNAPSSSKIPRTEFCDSYSRCDVGPLEILKTLSAGELNLSNIESLIMLLTRKKEVLTAESRSHEKILMFDFLNQLLKVKKAERERLDKELHLVEQDLSQMSSRPSSDIDTILKSDDIESGDDGMAMSCSSSDLEGFNTQVISDVGMKDKTIAARKMRMHTHFDELADIYLDLRKAELHDSRSNDATVPNDSGDSFDYEDLDRFGETLCRISQYSSLKPLCTLSYSADVLSNNNIVSSIEFDKDNELFAIAGVTKKIKIFEYGNVIGTTADIHCPSAELLCTAKISCVSWSTYYKNRLASSDYDGCVSLWDTSVTTRTRTMNEHEKRVWSVDWSNGDPRLLASGSDDAKVKLWTTNAERSVATIEAKANVCCVKFCPQSSFIVAFGCADHCIHYYDFRQLRQPLSILAGHKKAVSYVKFASKTEVVSASTDSHLKLWDLESPTGDCVRSYTGHINEKNFVGLATDGNYIACGSENNGLYVYYRNLSRPLLHFKFDNYRNMLDKPKPDDTGEFVSAVVWRKGSPIIAAANSQGLIKILELT